VTWSGTFAFNEAGNTYDMPRALAHAAAKRELVAVQQPADWTLPSILRPPEVLTESELVEAEAELRAPQRHALEIVDPEDGRLSLTREWSREERRSIFFVRALSRRERF
jgi:hypothetical protein